VVEEVVQEIDQISTPTKQIIAEKPIWLQLMLGRVKGKGKSKGFKQDAC
jgi:hypothetical protein